MDSPCLCEFFSLYGNEGFDEIYSLYEVEYKMIKKVSRKNFLSRFIFKK
jgi:hypothetical protein